ncbi:hypothetical protein LTR56_024590 [Elasticomyces elasticus]|nr:hypothetical protein LTR56_024590 [Elasticomyces elasticus]KAK3622418.1 hypothetical protein LTR22_024803 [Elasticomyces elasticus]KAK4905471.1 hypothetical protein LTR49_025248 [Elasticomyces elasticus]KAK5746093.1 hypothetical protein LTS12_022860 [Elasticomyces elasticus]
MPILGRNAPKLLRAVRGKPHASDEDHEYYSIPKTAKQLPTPESSNNTISSGFKVPKKLEDIDIYADPISSDDERFKAATRVPSPPVKEEEPEDFKHIPQFDGSQDALKSKTQNFRRASTRSAVKQESPPTTAFRVPAIKSSPSSAGSKRKVEDWELESDENDATVFSSQPKRSRVSRNIFAPPRSSKPPQSSYGQKAQRKRSREEQERREAEAKRVKEAEQAEKANRNAFKRVNVPAAFACQDNAASLFKIPDKRFSDDDAVLGAEDDRNSIDLSDLSDAASSPPPEVVASFDLPSAVRRLECTVCGDSVTVSQREDFEDRFEQAKVWNYKWQQRFCRYHKQIEASQLWVERSYPTVDWIRLESRLKQSRHIEHIERMISGETSSAFRKQFQRKVKSRAKTLLQAADDENAGKGGSAGYYGPRGEKLMSDHITSSFADELRSHAIRDTLVASAGVSGGLSGFIQSVLVPELAVSLIREDLELQKRTLDPMKVLEDSAELGEIMHPEVEDQVRVGARHDVESDA